MKQLLLLLLCIHFGAFAQSDNNFEKANTAFAQKQYDEAYIYLKNSLQQQPSHLPSKILMGKVLALSFYYNDAILEFYEVLEQGADPNLVIEFLTSSLLVEQRYVELASISDRGLSDKTKAILFANQGQAQFQLGNQNDAQQLFLKATQLQPNSAPIWNAFAGFQLSTEQIDVAEISANKAVELNPEFSEAYRTLARINKLKGNITAHVLNLQTALTLEPDQPLALRDLVTAYMEAEEYQKAEETLQKVLASSPQDPMAQFLLSWVQTQLGQIDLSQNTLNDLVNYLSLIDSDTLAQGSGLLYISGMANYAAGNLEAATQDLQSFIAKQPQSLNASILLAELYELDNSLASAIKVLERFGREAQTNLSLGAKLCTLYLKTNLNHKCDRLVNELKKNHQNDADFILLNSRLLATRGKTEDALAELEKIPTNSANLMVNKALLKLQMNDFDGAKGALEALISEYPQEPDYENLMAGALIKEGKQEQAIEVLDSLLDKTPQHFAARFNLASIYVDTERSEQAKVLLAELNAERPQQSAVLLLLARAEKALGNLETAVDILRTVRALSPNMTEAKVELADVYARVKDYDKALLILNTLVKENFLEASYIAQRADVLVRSGNFDAAQKDLSTLFGIYKNDSTALYDLALFQKRAQDLDGALKSVAESVKLNPQQYLPYLELARLTINANRINDAEDALKTIKASFGDSPDYWLLKGDLAVLKNNLQEASTDYYKAIVKDPAFSQALIKSYELAKLGYNTEAFKNFIQEQVTKGTAYDFMHHLAGDLYLELSEYEAAKDHYTIIISNNRYDNLPYVLNNLANVYLLEADYDKAYVLAKRANDQLGQEQAILDTLGWSLAKLGKYTEGLRYLRESFSMNTADPAVRYHLAYTLNKLNRNSEAKRELENLLTQFDSFDDRENALALFNELQ